MTFEINHKNKNKDHVVVHQGEFHITDHHDDVERNERKHQHDPSSEELSMLIAKSASDDHRNPSSLPMKRCYYMQMSFLAIFLCVLWKFDILGKSFFQQNQENDKGGTAMKHKSMLNTILDSTIRASVPSSTSIKQSLAGKSSLTEIGVQELFEIFPLPIDNNIIQIYNENTYSDLINTLSTRNITITVNGGSASAGGGSIKKENRYHSFFAKHLEELRNDSFFQIRVVDRSHGSRHSLHSAVFNQNFMPVHTDVLIWEFAINDFGYHHSGSQEDRMHQERSMMIAWLREVQKMTPEPPKVILLYLWKAPFDINEDKNIINPVFESHSLVALAKEFDFVVGHVNVAAYLDEQKTITFEDKKSLFLIDMHHPNNAGHLMISFLLLNLLRRPEKRTNSISYGYYNDKSSTVGKYNWFCGNETEDKKFIRDRIVQSHDSEWISPLGTITLEKPSNTYIRPGSKQLVLTSNEEQKVLGKQDPLRRDRRGSVSIACCNHSSNNNYTSISISKKAEPMKNVQAIFLGMGIGFSDMKKMKIYINSNNENINGRLIRVPYNSWPCFWNWRDIYDSWWFAFSEEQSRVSTIDLCVENEKCSENGESDALLISMAVYA